MEANDNLQLKAHLVEIAMSNYHRGYRKGVQIGFWKGIVVSSGIGLILLIIL